MAMPQVVEHYWLPDEVRALPDDGKRYECLDGELIVTPAPAFRHQRALLALVLRLHPYVAEHGLGELYFAPADVQVDPRNLLQPDLFVATSRGPVPMRSTHDIAELRLVIEVSSPSTARYDRVKKRRYYVERAGAHEYWVVDLDAGVVERWRRGDARPEVAEETLEWRPVQELQPLVVPLVALFDAAGPA